MVVISLGDPLEVNSQYSRTIQYFDQSQVQSMLIYVSFCHLVSKSDIHMFINSHLTSWHSSAKSL